MDLPAGVDAGGACRQRERESRQLEREERRLSGSNVITQVYISTLKVAMNGPSCLQL